MANLAQRLSDALRIPVADFTQKEGRFNFKLSWDPEESDPLATTAAGKPPRTPTGPSIFDALQEQIGLKLDPAKLPVEVLVIDSADRPSEN